MNTAATRASLRAALGLVATAALATGLLTAPTATAQPAATPAQVAAPVPDLDWSRCEYFPRSLCATAEVPLDYDEPTGATTLIDLVKVPALKPASKLGTLFVNPGGPGGSARGFAPYAADLLGDTVALKYDVIGIDPRGVGSSAPMSCETTADPPSFRYFLPVNERQSRSAWRDGRFLRNACVEGPSEIVAHMSTADTARDMDLIRQAVGEEQLNYYGISYGTYLGAVYAALFPGRVGRFVVDGVLDPINWATGDGTNSDLPFSTRLRSARGAYEALTSALTECDRVGKRKCPFAGNAQQKWQRLVTRAKNKRLKAFGQRLQYQLLVGYTLGELYSNQGYDFLGYFLQEVYRRNFKKARVASRPLGITLEQMRKIARDTIQAPYAARGTIQAPYVARAVDAANPFLGVACSDSENPRGRPAWWDAGRAQDRRFRWFGSLWTWASAPCSGWPEVTKGDSFLGPFETETANPILVVGNSFDPATPVQGARRFTTLFGGRFLLMDGWGHGALTNTCVTAAFDAYYDTGALPREGSVCEPDFPLYGGFGGFFRPVDAWRPQAG